MSVRAFVSVVNVDVREIDVDVIVLKYAQAFYGADAAVAQRLELNVVSSTIGPTPGQHVIFDSAGAVRGRKVLFIGVPPLNVFSYQDVRKLSSDALRILAKEAPSITSVAFTIHGPGFGLDEVECVEEQLQGFRDALSAFQFPHNLKEIFIVDRDKSRIDLIESVLAKSISRDDRFLTPSDRRFLQAHGGASNTPHVLLPGNGNTLQRSPSSKGKVFVAMPFSKELRDVWTFGIQQPVRSAGLLCERLDNEAFTGDILSQIKERIEKADLVIADVTGANPNVFLEIGYAWGKSRPTLLLCRKPARWRADQQHLPFDVSGHKCILYEDATHLCEQLERELTKLAVSGA